MYLYEPYTFHKSYPLDSFLEETKVMESEKERMLSYLPKEYQSMQRKVEEACDRMEYEGSRMYDEHPDREQIYRMAKKIKEQLSKDCESDFCRQDRYSEDVVCCFLCNEIFHRRYRTWRSKQYLK